MTDRQITHAPGCWGWGPRHYECVLREIEALREEVERLKSMTAVTMGVGSGGGNLFVHGDYESIKAAQAIMLERGALHPSGLSSGSRSVVHVPELQREQAETQAERLAEALRELEEREKRDEALLRQALEALEQGAWDTMRGRNVAAAIRERLGEGERQ